MRACIAAPEITRVEEAELFDVKDIIGTLMRIGAGEEVSIEEVLDLEFDAEGEVLVALNEAYIRLLEFAHDRDARAAAPSLDRMARSGLQECLSKIVELC